VTLYCEKEKDGISLSLKLMVYSFEPVSLNEENLIEPVNKDVLPFVVYRTRC